MEKKDKNTNSYPVWLYMFMSFSIPMYGFFYFSMVKDRHPKRAKTSLLFTFTGLLLWLIALMLIY